MKPLLIQVAATGLYILAASAIGYWMNRKRKPYGWIKSTLHILLVAGVAAGWLSCMFNLHALAKPRLSPTLFMASRSLMILMAATIVLNLVLGSTMLIKRKIPGALPALKWTSTAVMFLSLSAVGTILATS
jgi:hypothetical protein